MKIHTSSLRIIALTLVLAASTSAQTFHTSDRCVACHNGLSTPTGEDISIGHDWSATMMANAGRDPYWHAGVRRESIDHPESQAVIEDECATCHMPMARYEAHAAGDEGEVFSHLPFAPGAGVDNLAADGVSCTVCHQIEDGNFGTRESFVGGFLIGDGATDGSRPVYGPFELDRGRQTIMRSSTGGFQPTEGAHVRQSELCATCHTLITRALGPGGEVIGELPEQVPYQEWLHSDYRESRSCQACHMPVVEEDVAIARVLGQPREGFSRHVFVGGNFFILRILNKHRDELGVAAESRNLDASVARTKEHLQTQSAQLSVDCSGVSAGRLQADVAVQNLAGHKLPTAYPSRRVWLHVTLRDQTGRVVFESGAIEPSGLIQGNDNDADAGRIEPHYTEITSPDQVQIYESVMVDPQGNPTTGLLSAVRFGKDNRLLPLGFDKQTAAEEIAVCGGAADDEDFMSGGDRVRYSMPVGDARGPFQVEAELWYQPIAYRWAENLRSYDSMETNRFTGYYSEMSAESALMLRSESIACASTP